MLNEHSCRYHPYSHSELSLVIFRYEIGTGFINKQTNKQILNNEDNTLDPNGEQLTYYKLSKPRTYTEMI